MLAFIVSVFAGRVIQETCLICHCNQCPRPTRDSSLGPWPHARFFRRTLRTAGYSIGQSFVGQYCATEYWIPSCFVLHLCRPQHLSKWPMKSALQFKTAIRLSLAIRKCHRPPYVRHRAWRYGANKWHSVLRYRPPSVQLLRGTRRWHLQLRRWLGETLPLL